MSAYIARRIFLMLPTLLGILFVSFVVVQFAPGGPVERVIAQLSGADTGGTSRISGSGSDFGARGQVGASADAVNSKYRGAQGWTLISSRAWKNSSASTSRRRSALP
jgi:microcin C transport system permease protein